MKMFCEIQLVIWNLQQSALHVFLSLIHWALHTLHASEIHNEPIQSYSAHAVLQGANG